MATEKWEAHIGEDYAVVMLPGECTENASITVAMRNSKLVYSVAAIPSMLEALERILSLTPEDSQVHKIAEFAVRQAR